jgi:hypothetical protein
MANAAVCTATQLGSSFVPGSQRAITAAESIKWRTSCRLAASTQRRSSRTTTSGVLTDESARNRATPSSMRNRSVSASPSERAESSGRARAGPLASTKALQDVLVGSRSSVTAGSPRRKGRRPPLPYRVRPSSNGPPPGPGTPPATGPPDASE